MLASVSTKYPPAAIIVLAAIWYMVRFALLSLSHQPPMLIACEVVLCSSIMSPPATSGLASTSLTTIEPGSGVEMSSAVPGVPPGSPLGTQPAAELNSDCACVVLRTVSENPPSTVWAYQSGL